MAKRVKLEIWDTPMLDNQIFIGYFPDRDTARRYCAENIPDHIGCDCIAVDDQILMGNDEW
jgi:hypothetical protein